MQSFDDVGVHCCKVGCFSDIGHGVVQLYGRAVCAIVVQRFFLFPAFSFALAPRIVFPFSASHGAWTMNQAVRLMGTLRAGLSADQRPNVVSVDLVIG